MNRRNFIRTLTAAAAGAVACGASSVIGLVAGSRGSPEMAPKMELDMKAWMQFGPSPIERCSSKCYGPVLVADTEHGEFWCISDGGWWKKTRMSSSLYRGGITLWQTKGSDGKEASIHQHHDLVLSSDERLSREIDCFIKIAAECSKGLWIHKTSRNEWWSLDYSGSRWRRTVEQQVPGTEGCGSVTIWQTKGSDGKEASIHQYHVPGLSSDERRSLEIDRFIETAAKCSKGHFYSWPDSPYSWVRG